MKKIAFVCVDFNGIEYTRELCESLERQSGCDVEFSLYCLVVDNSTDADASKNLQKMLASNEISFIILLVVIWGILVGLTQV
jgi:hypothetical protein